VPQVDALTMGNRVITADRRRHYEVEIELARRLRSASKEERRTLYTQLYDELFARVPDHPQLISKQDPAERARSVQVQLAMLSPFLRRKRTFLELGPGDCALSFAVARRVERCYGVDVSAEITRSEDPPDNFRLLLSNGSDIPLPDGSIDVAYSDQLMEHLHDEDAVDQLREIYRVLVPGGVYICITPNRLSGPHDVSKYFDEVARGFHLHEYTASELHRILCSCGFARTDVLVGKGRLTFRVSRFGFELFERCAAHLPRSFRRSGPMARLLGVKIAAWKSARVCA
jgi:SAM-dependent methyltransferase